MEEILITIPQSTSTKTGDFQLSFDSTDKIPEILSNNSATLLVLEILGKLKENAQIDYDIPSPSSNLEKFKGTKLYSYFLNFNIPFSSSINYILETPEKEKEKKRFKKLISYFNSEVKKYPHYITSPRKEAINLFNIIAEQIAQFTFSDSLVELTPDNTFKIKVLLPNNELLVISKSFHNLQDLKDNEVVFSLFRNKKCLLSQAIDIVDLVKSINEYLDIR